MTRLRVAGAALLITVAGFAPDAAAHDVDVTGVARVFLDELFDGEYRMSVVDRLVPPIGDARQALPSRCQNAAGPDDQAAASGLSFSCGGGLQANDVIVLPWSLPGVVVLARWNEGTEASAYFRGDGARVVVELGALRAAAGSRRQLAARYFGLGWEHILYGIDHLLFVAGLLLLVHGAGTLVETITAFTVAHSITLGVAALGYVRVPAAPVEAAIALSIVLLARELVVGTTGRVHLIHRRPWIVAFVFGLLHGFGFAGALGDLGLRAGDVPMALLFFNLGVEAGQLVFVFAALAALALASSALPVRARAAAADGSGASWRPAVQLAIGYAIGVIAVRWLIERLPALGA